MTMIIDGTNGLTFPDTSKQYNSYYSFKNRIINGAMVIDQRNAGASGTAIAYTVDRFGYYATQASKGTWQQNAGSVTPPTGFKNYLGFTSSSAYSVLSTDQFILYQNIEGLNVSDLAWGTASAATVTLSFWVRSSLTGTFGGSLQNSAFDRSYPFSFTISAANTWEQKTVTIAGDTTGTWLTTNGIGVAVNFSLGMGSSKATTAGAWAAGNYQSATGATSVVGTNGATFYITGVQLEKGTQATSFDYRPYGTELALCQRYFQNGTNAIAVGASATIQYGSLTFMVEMRANPTIATTAAIATTDGVSADYAQSSGSISIDSGRVTTRAVSFQMPNFTGLTSYRVYQQKPANGGTITLSAEL